MITSAPAENHDQGQVGGLQRRSDRDHIAIMVLEMKVPHGDRVENLVPLLPTLLSYVLSFVYVGIYWNNHHHLLHVLSLEAEFRRT